MNSVSYKAGLIERLGSATLLLIFCLVMAGCTSNSPDPRVFNTPPNNAYALSGGKITGFSPMPGLESSSSDKTLLEACQQLPLNKKYARSAILVITTEQFGKCPFYALVVGDRVLMLSADFVTMGMNHALIFGGSSAPDNGNGMITLIPDSKIAFVGQQRVRLRDQVSKTFVMNWADMQTLLHERDRQLHRSPFIRDFKIIYNIQDYHR